MAGRDLVLGVRPEHVRLNDGARLRGEVLGTEYLGTTQIVTVTTTNGVVKARLPSTLKASIGDSVGLEFRPDRISLFDAGSGRAIRTALYDHVQATEPAHV
jgi:multiple sugar transport system ATP-binding protein